MRITIQEHDINSTISEVLERHRRIAIMWDIEDVQMVRPDLNNNQAWRVLEECKRNHDSNIGITWDVIEITADDLFPEDEVATNDAEAI